MQGVPSVENTVPGLFIRHPDFLKTGPVSECRDIVLKFSGLGERLAEYPYSLVEIPHLIAVMMVRTLTASVSETLVESVVHCIYNLLNV